MSSKLLSRIKKPSLQKKVINIEDTFSHFKNEINIGKLNNFIKKVGVGKIILI